MMDQSSLTPSIVIKRLRVAPFEIIDTADAERPQVFGDGLADTWDNFQLAQRSLLVIRHGGR